MTAPNSTAPEKTVPPASEQTKQQPPKSGWKQRLYKLIWGLLAIIILMIGFSSWLLGTQSGLRFAVLTVPKWFGIQTHVEQLSGSVWQGFSGINWHIQNQQFQLDFNKLTFDWNHQELWHKHLHIRRLEIGKIQFISEKSAPKPDSPPLSLPKSIHLPIKINVDTLIIEGLTLGKNQQTVLLPSQLSYVYDHNKHQLNLIQLATPWHMLTGAINLNTLFPFALHGQFKGHGKIDKTEGQSQINLDGSLKQPHLQAKLVGDAIHLGLNAELRPFAQQLNQKIVYIDLQSEHLNPAAFAPSLPLADLNIKTHIASAQNQPELLNGFLHVTNQQARAINDKHHIGIPIRSLNGLIQIDQQDRILFPQLTAELLHQGQISLNGQIDHQTQKLALNTQLKQISAKDVLINNLAGKLNGSIHSYGHFNQLHTDWKLNTDKVNSNGSVHIVTDTKNHQQTLLLQQLAINPLQGGSFNAKGSLALYQDKALKLSINSKNFNPAKLNSAFPIGQINGQAEINGTLATEPDIKLNMQWHNSQLSGAPLSGKTALHYQNKHLSQANINLQLGKNHISSQGAFGLASDKLNLDINAPNLDLFGFGLKGLVNIKGYLTGEPTKLTANLAGLVRQLQFKQILNIANLDFNITASPDVTLPLNIDIKGQNIHFGKDSQATIIQQAAIKINGRGNHHQLLANSDASVAGKPYHLNLQANGGMNKDYQWQGHIQNLNLNGALNVKLLSPIQLEAGPQKILLNQARFAALGGSLNINHLNWEKNQGLNTQGKAQSLDLRELHNIFVLPVKQNLILNSDWNFSYNQDMHGYLKIDQQSGDIILPQHQQALGLNKVHLETRFQNNHINNHLSGTTRYGTVDMILNIAQQYGRALTEAPIQGQIKVNSTDLSNLRNLLPIGMQLKGLLNADATIKGNLTSPLLNGHLTGNNLYYRDQSSGAVLENGNLKSHFEGRRWIIDNFKFSRNQGQLNLSGLVDMTQLTPDVNVTALFDHYTILDKINSRLTISGKANLLYTIAHGITLNGNLQVDKSRFGFQKSGMPKLDDDVIVLGRENPQLQQKPTPIRLNLLLNLNNAFRFDTDGIDVLLGGQLTAKANAGENIQVIGTVNVVKGQYKAYGQDLVVQHGSTVSFIGPIDNPNLKIRAKRRYSPVGAGVEALGNLSNPRINLIANEAMSDKDKLSWLILNRASSGSAGDEAAIAAAASALLAGGINNRLGLFDEIGLTSQQSRNSETGEMNPAEQAITIGKHISNNLYISYLYGIESATQTISLTYQISRILQGIARFSTESIGGELRYTHRFD